MRIQLAEDRAQSREWIRAAGGAYDGRRTVELTVRHVEHRCTRLGVESARRRIDGHTDDRVPLSLSVVHDAQALSNRRLAGGGPPFSRQPFVDDDLMRALRRVGEGRALRESNAHDAEVVTLDPVIVEKTGRANCR